MIVEVKGATLLIESQYTVVIPDVPRECTECHTMSRWFENRDGGTSCVSCVVRKERQG